MEEEIEYRGRRIFATPHKAEDGRWHAKARIEFHHAADIEMKVVSEPNPERAFDSDVEAARRSMEIAMRWIDQDRG